MPIFTIAQTPFYVIAVDPAKNRLYLTSKGFWASKDDVPNYLEDLTQALEKLEPGFDLLNDSTEVETTPEDVNMQVVFPAVKMLQAKQLNRTAQVVPTDLISNLNTELLLDDVRRKETKLMQFDNVQEAERWLDAD